MGDGVAYALVGIEHDPTGAVIDQADRQRQPQLAAAALAMRASATSRWKRPRLWELAPERPRSSSMTTT